MARVSTPATPAYWQSVDQFRNYLVAGKLTPGEVLPGLFRHFTFAPSATILQFANSKRLPWGGTELNLLFYIARALRCR